ncbi:uncharacterized protein Pyn_05946 [Prunus yedoensis var. nudiflora]|uniref:Uncharacterized protein n=1 Tax=Prunus yedoensis var. nudiflora TaxID=2094558 RepID=A0A314XMB3_PRUYE|nr:uncharacterized protein Pyn_05946 [Prunus yedoensis var. nudiflora]
MEGVGSRLGRASSRYGQTTTVFSGPVRRWKKKWVHVPSSSSATYQNPHSQSNGNNNSSRLLLRRWTPIFPATPAAEPLSGSGASMEEPPRRKFRYTPVSVLEEQKKAAKGKVGDVVKASEGGQSIATSTKMHENSNIDQVMEEQAEELDEDHSGLQDSNGSHLDLDLGLKGHSANRDSVTQIEDAQMKKASPGRFWLG